MNNDVLMTLSIKIERLYSRMLASETNSKLESDNMRKDIYILKNEIEKTNDILEKIYHKLN